MAANILSSIQVQLTAKTSEFSSEMDKAAKKAAAASREIKQAVAHEMQESKHSLHLLKDVFGVEVPRAIRGFVSELPGVGKAMSTAFNALAIVVVVQVLQEAYEKVKEFREALEAMHEAPEKITQGFHGLSSELQSHNDKLALTNDNLRNAIAKLEGKPQNNLAIALDEARIHANDLATALQNDIKKTQDLLEKNKATWMQKTFFGISGDEDLTKQNKDYAKSREELAQEHQAKVHEKLSPEELKEANHEFYEKDQGLIRKRREWLQGQLGATLDEQKSYASLDLNHDGSKFDPRIAKLRGLIANTFVEEDADKLDQENLGLTNKKQTLEKAKFDSEKASELKDLKDKLSANGLGSMADSLTKMPGHSQLNHIHQVLAAVEAQHKDLAASVAESNKRFATDNEREIGRLVQAQQGYVKALEHSDEIQEKASFALTAEVIKYNESTGAITKNDAARRLANLHTQEYQATLTRLQSKLDEIQRNHFLTNDEKLFQSQAVRNQMMAVTGDYNVRQYQDSNSIQSSLTSASAGFHDFFEQFIKEAANTRLAVLNAMTSTVNGVNQEIGKAMTGQQTSWGKTFQSSGQGLIQSGLKTGEGALMKAFHLEKFFKDKRQDVNIVGIDPQVASVFNGGRDTGFGSDNGASGGWRSSVTSLFTSKVASASGLASGFAKFLPMLSHVIPGFAEGGDPDPYRTSIVGENGPELFTPKGVAGHVTSNKDLGKLGSSSLTQHFTIDARGSNPAEVDMRVRQGAAAAYSQAMQDAPRAQQERARRRPSSFRG